MTARFDLEVVSAYVDGDLESPDRERFEAALAENASLAEAVKEVRTLRNLALQAVPSGPSRDLWPGIRARVLRRSWFSIPRIPPVRWGLVAVSMAAMIGAVWVMQKPDLPTDMGLDEELDAARGAYVTAVDRLEVTARARSVRLSPVVRAKVEASLAAVDHEISECEAALRKARGSAERSQFLLALYDEKVRVLKAVIEATDEPEPQSRAAPPRGFGRQEAT